MKQSRLESTARLLYPVWGGHSMARLGLVAALLSATVGVLWDGAWHLTYTRDRFFSPPHMLLYSGVTIGLLISLRIIAVSSWRPGVRRHLPGPMSSFGRLKAPPGIFVVLAGSLTILSAAPFDEWWHQTFGLDTTVWSPPHMVGFFGATVAGIGVLAFLSKAGRVTVDALRMSDVRSWAIVVVMGCWTLFAGAMALGPFGTYYELRIDPGLYPISLSLVTVLTISFSQRATSRGWVGVAMVLAQWAINIGVGVGLSAAGYTRVVSPLPMSMGTALVLAFAFARWGDRRLWPLIAGALTPITLFPVEALWSQTLTGQVWPLFDTLEAFFLAIPLSLIGAMAGEWMGLQVNSGESDQKQVS